MYKYDRSLCRIQGLSTLKTVNLVAEGSFLRKDMIVLSPPQYEFVKEDEPLCVEKNKSGFFIFDVR